MERHELSPAPGAKKSKTRIGRGIGSGSGKTAGRGTKGQKARRNIQLGFEGGQTPMHRRLPHRKGFRNPNHKEFAVVNLDDLHDRFTDGDDVNPETLQSKGLVKKLMHGVKVLGRGDIQRKLKVSAHFFSKVAEEKLAAAGCEVVKL